MCRLSLCTLHPQTLGPSLNPLLLRRRSTRLSLGCLSQVGAVCHVHQLGSRRQSTPPQTDGLLQKHRLHQHIPVLAMLHPYDDEGTTLALLQLLILVLLAQLSFDLHFGPAFRHFPQQALSAEMVRRCGGINPAGSERNGGYVYISFSFVLIMISYISPKLTMALNLVVVGK